MKREFKFRVWDKENNFFIFTNLSDDYFPCVYSGEEEIGRYIIQQFTGIYDITGKEIYEGDFITCLKSGNTILIKYDRYFSCDNNDINFVGFNLGIYPPTGNHFIIRGNIFENHGLLEGK